MKNQCLRRICDVEVHHHSDEDDLLWSRAFSHIIFVVVTVKIEERDNGTIADESELNPLAYYLDAE